MSTATPLNVFYSTKERGLSARKQNVQAVDALAKIMSTSLGPNGLDKMLVDGVGELTVTNDGATILELLEVQHPAAKVLVDLSSLQDREIGDGTTSVVILAAELIKRGQSLIEQGIHPTWIIQAYKSAGKEAVKYIKNELCVDMASLPENIALEIAKTSLASKLAGADSEFFADIVQRAVNRVRTVDSKGKVKYPIQAISILKTQGRGTRESFLVDGYALAHIGRASQAMPKCVNGAKIACLELSLKQYRAPLGVQVLINNAEELAKIREMEKDITKKKVLTIIAAGANVVFTTEGIDDMALKYFVEAGVFVVRRVPQMDLRRIARSTGSKVVLTMASPDSDEDVFESEWLGNAESVYEDRVGDWDFIFVKGTLEGAAGSIVLRGANDYLNDEMERCLHDALCVVSKTMESQKISPGGGAVEMAVALHLEKFSRTLEPQAQAAVEEFAQALLSIPRQLAVNAAQDATDLVAKLKTQHVIGLMDKSPDYKFYGLDLLNGTIRNNLQAGVVEPSMIKTKSIRFATEAAVTILRVDDLVRCEETPEERMEREAAARGQQ